MVVVDGISGEEETRVMATQYNIAAS